jgi:protein SCO1/2
MRLLITLLILSLLTAFSSSCQKGANQGGTLQNQSSAKRYHLKGKVVSIDKRANMVNIDGEQIPGFMEAMIMPYLVKPAGELDKLSPGDLVTADIVVEGDDSWLENIAVTGHSSAPPTK